MADRRPDRIAAGSTTTAASGMVTGPGSASSSAPVLRSAPASPSARPGPAPGRRHRAALPPSGGTPSQRNAINIPPANENRFVKDEVVLEFAGALPRPAISRNCSRGIG